MFLRFSSFKGPQSFTWKDPDTGREFRENSKELLIERIREYRSGNNLQEIERLSFVLEHYWCTLPENANNCQPAEVKRGLLGYIKGGVALVSDVLTKNFCSQGEAEKRAAICVGCPHNVFPDRQGFLLWSDNLAYHANADRVTSKDDELGNCAVCSCPLRTKVHKGGTIALEKEWIEPMKKVGCWQLPEEK
jgi:hypothetical protein